MTYDERKNDERKKEKQQDAKHEAYVMFVTAMLSNPKVVDEEKLSVHTNALVDRLHEVAMLFIDMMAFPEL